MITRKIEAIEEKARLEKEQGDPALRAASQQIGKLAYGGFLFVDVDAGKTVTGRGTGSTSTVLVYRAAEMRSWHDRSRPS